MGMHVGQGKGWGVGVGCVGEGIHKNVNVDIV